MQELNSLRLLGIDPGTGHIGVSIGSLILNDDNSIIGLKLEDVYTIFTDRLVNRHYSEYSEKFGQRAAMLRAGLDSILKYVETWKPFAIGYEDSYLGNRGGATAFGSGKEIQAKVVEGLRNLDSSLRIEIFEPSLAKRVIKVHGRSKDKKEVVKALYNAGYLDTNGFNLDNLTEHACDSIMLLCNIYLRIVEDYNK